MLRLHVDPDAVTSGSNTPLHLAVQHRAVVDVLLKAKAQICVADGIAAHTPTPATQRPCFETIDAGETVHHIYGVVYISQSLHTTQVV